MMSKYAVTATSAMAKSPTGSVAAVVVSYNRKDLLRKCLSALALQTRKPDMVLVVDNASTDGTQDWLLQWLPQHLPQATPVPLQQNLGGAGGFSEGMRRAVDNGADWLWMMDDDAEPRPDALEELVEVATDTGNVYGSLATNGAETSWTMTLLGEAPLVTSRADDVPATCRVEMLPFLGFMIHRELVARIGLPDPGFFIAADDVEYCLRAQGAGAHIIVAGRSRIEHPKSRPYKATLAGHTLTVLELPPWKRYYDTRNRLLIARRHHGLKLFTQALPGSIVRLFATLTNEPRKLEQLRAFAAGTLDGLLGIKGRRHEFWGIH